MRKTTFAGITVLENGESLVQDDGSFTGKDRDTIDFFLERGAKTHRHTGLAGLTNPSVAASGGVHASGGTIPSDLDLVFGYTLQDDERGETILSPTATISTPAPLARPENTIVATLDYLAGSLTVDSYYYAITYIDGEGGETPLGPTTIAIRQSGHANAQVVLTGLDDGVLAAGAAGWRLYRARSGGQFAFLAEGTGDTFTDDGSVSAICDTQPPNDEFNTTNEINSIVITLPDAGDIDPEAAFINVYLSDSGAFTGSVFLDQFPVASAGADVVYRDLVLQPDSPPVVSTAVGGPPKIDGDTEIDWGDGGVPGNPSVRHSPVGPVIPDVRLVQFAASGAVNVAVTDDGGGSATVVVANLGRSWASGTVAAASGATADFSLDLAAGMRLLKISTNKKARVRVYGDAASRTADAARPVGTDPTGNHGVLLDYANFTSAGDKRLSPALDVHNLDDPPLNRLYLSVTNHEASGDVVVAFLLQRTEIV